MSMGDELASLDFESMIGGPLSAVVRAQAQAAVTSVDFIKAVGFTDGGDEDNPQPVMVKFTYQKPVEVKDAEGNAAVESQTFELSVPFLTMVPIPFIRVEETTIDFNAKITSVQSTSSATSHGLGSSLTAKAGWGWGSAKLKVNYSYQKSRSSTGRSQRTYSMAVRVRAVQDEMPAGTERLLSILEGNIDESKTP